MTEGKSRKALGTAAAVLALGLAGHYDAEGSTHAPAINNGQATICNQTRHEWRRNPSARPCAWVRIYEDGSASVTITKPNGYHHHVSIGAKGV